jgi:hypothetical protein
VNRRPVLARLPATLLAESGANVPDCRYRLLVVGPAILHRPHGEPGPWRVRVSADGSLLPLAPATAGGLAARLAILRRTGCARLAAAILEPRDLPLVAPLLRDALRRRPAATRRREFYGWALLYRLPGGGSEALVDPDERFPDLPTAYESPLELADRQAFLARRGVPSRAIALVTQRDDFDAAEGQVPRNRFCPQASWRRACDAVPFAR